MVNKVIHNMITTLYSDSSWNLHTVSITHYSHLSLHYLRRYKGIFRGESPGGCHARNGHKEWLPRLILLPNGHTLIDGKHFTLVIYNFNDDERNTI